MSKRHNVHEEPAARQDGTRIAGAAGHDLDLVFEFIRDCPEAGRAARRNPKGLIP